MLFRYASTPDTDNEEDTFACAAQTSQPSRKPVTPRLKPSVTSPEPRTVTVSVNAAVALAEAPPNNEELELTMASAPSTPGAADALAVALSRGPDELTNRLRAGWLSRRPVVSLDVPPAVTALALFNTV